MKREIVKFNVFQNGKKKYWYVDTTELSLSELIKFKKELLVGSTRAHAYVDDLINERVNASDTVREFINDEIRDYEFRKCKRNKKVRYRKKR